VAFTTDEVRADFLSATRANFVQPAERLRRGRNVFANDVWHIAGWPLTTVAAAGGTLNLLIATPWLNGPPFPLRAIACNIAAIGGAGSVMRIGIYAADETRVYPTALLVDSGSIDTTIAGFKNIPINLSLDLGLIYFFVSIIGVAAPTITSAASWLPSLGWSVNFAAIANGWQVAQAFGPLPAVFPVGATLNTAGFPLVGVLGS